MTQMTLPPAQFVPFADAPIAYAVAIVCVAVAAVLMVRSHVLLRQSRQYRIDLRPGQSVFKGESLMWELNVYNPRNYVPGVGRPLVRRMLMCTGVSFVALCIAFVLAFCCIVYVPLPAAP